MKTTISCVTFLLLNIKEVIIINNITMGGNVCLTKTTINEILYQCCKSRPPGDEQQKTRSDNNELYHYDE